MSKGKFNNKQSNNKSQSTNNKSQSAAVKSKQFKSQKPVISKNVKNVEVEISKKKPVVAKPVLTQSAPKTSIKKEIVPAKDNKKVIKKENVPAKDSKKIINKEVEVEEEEDMDDVDLSDMESYDLDASEDDIDEDDVSDMDDDDIFEDDDSDIDEIDSEGEIAYAEDDDVSEEEEEDSEKPVKKEEIIKKAEPAKKEVKKVEPAKKEVKKVEPAKKEVKKAEPVKKEVKEVEPVKETVTKKVVEEKKVEVKKAEPVKEINPSTEGGKILIEMNRRKNTLAPNSIHISRLSETVTCENLKEILENVVDVFLPVKLRNKVNKNRGYGYIRFSTAADAAKATDVINATTLGGKKMVCNTFVCKKVMDNIDQVDFSRIVLTSFTMKNLTEELKTRFATGVNISMKNAVTYELIFDNKSDAMALFNKEKINVAGGDLLVNFSYGLTAFPNNAIPVATVEVVKAPVVVAKAGMKRSKCDSDEEEITAVKKVKVDSKTPEKKVQNNAAKTPEKSAAKTPEKKAAEIVTKTPENNNNKKRKSQKKNTPKKN